MHNLTVEDYINLLLEPSMVTVNLWSIDDERDVFTGDVDDIPEKYLDREIQSIDVPTEPYKVGLNI